MSRSAWTLCPVLVKVLLVGSTSGHMYSPLDPLPTHSGWPGIPDMQHPESAPPQFIHLVTNHTLHDAARGWTPATHIATTIHVPHCLPTNSDVIRRETPCPLENQAQWDRDWAQLYVLERDHLLVRILLVPGRKGTDQRPPNPRDMVGILRDTAARVRALNRAGVVVDQLVMASTCICPRTSNASMHVPIWLDKTWRREHVGIPLLWWLHTPVYDDPMGCGHRRGWWGSVFRGEPARVQTDGLYSLKNTFGATEARDTGQAIAVDWYPPTPIVPDGMDPMRWRHMAVERQVALCTLAMSARIPLIGIMTAGNMALAESIHGSAQYWHSATSSACRWQSLIVATDAQTRPISWSTGGSVAVFVGLLTRWGLGGMTDQVTREPRRGSITGSKWLPIPWLHFPQPAPYATHTWIRLRCSRAARCLVGRRLWVDMEDIPGWMDLPVTTSTWPGMHPPGRVPWCTVAGVLSDLCWLPLSRTCPAGVLPHGSRWCWGGSLAIPTPELMGWDITSGSILPNSKAVRCRSFLKGGQTPFSSSVKERGWTSSCQSSVVPFDLLVRWYNASGSGWDLRTVFWESS